MNGDSTIQQYKWAAIFTAVIFITVAAALTSQSQMYYMAALLLMLPVASYLQGMVALRNLEFCREAPAIGWDGDEVEFYIIATSKAKSARLFLQAVDHLPEWIEPANPGAVLFSVPAGLSIRIPYRVRLRKRGAFKLTHLTITAFDALGIFAFSKRISTTSEILVYPLPEEMKDVAVSGSERFGLRDLPIAATRGGGVDPDGVRAYVPGDPLRRMHWKSTARTGRLSVIEFEESRSVNVILALDLNRAAHFGHGRESTLEYLIRAAAAIAQTVVRQGAGIRLVSDDSARGGDNMGRGTDHLYAVLAGLARAEARDPLPLSATLVRRVGTVPPGTTVVVLTSGFDRELPPALQYYTFNGSRVSVVYADPNTFDPSHRDIPSLAQRGKLTEGILGARAEFYVLKQNPNSDLRPEETHFVDSLE